MDSWTLPLRFRDFEIKNRLIWASRPWDVGASAGSGLEQGDALEWELRYARAGVGAIISACPEVRPQGGLIPAIRADRGMARWQEHVGRVHAYRCKYIVGLGLAHAPGERLVASDLREVAVAFAEATGRAREMGADGVEIDGTSGSLIAEYLAPGVSPRPADYRGSFENRARLALEIVRAVRREVGPGFHFQMRLSISSPLEMLVAGTLRLIEWLEKEGVGAIHVVADADRQRGDIGMSGGVAARYVREAAQVPIVRSGWFETVELLDRALGDGSCDAVALERPREPLHLEVASLGGRDLPRASAGT